MLRLMIRHEARVLWRGHALRICALLLVTVVAFGVYNGASWARHQRETIDTITRQDTRTYDRIKADLADLARRGDPRPPLNLAGMAWYLLQPSGAAAPAPAPHLDPRRAEAAGSEWLGARHAVLPPAPLAALAIGQSDLFPYYSRVTIRTQPMLVGSDEIENPTNLVNGRFDLAFVLTFCWPLLVLPLAYNLLSDERDGGTLALIVSQPVSVRTVMLAKVLVRGGCAVLATTIAGLVALVAMANVPLASVAADLALLAGLVVANGVLWFGLAVWINSAGWRSGVNAMALTAGWLVWVVIVPSAISLWATTMAPVPSRVQLINQVRAAANLDASGVTELLTTYREQHPDVAPAATSADTVAMRGLALQDETDRRIAPVLADYRAARARQQDLVARLRFLSPSVLTYDAVGDLAGTSTTRYRRFADQLDAHHQAWRDYFYPLARRQTSLVADDYDRAPRFVFDEEPAGTVRTRVAMAVAVIGAIGLALLVAGLLRLSSRSALESA
jgi:ABC-2 type transport system permease protein